MDTHVYVYIYIHVLIYVLIYLYNTHIRIYMCFKKHPQPPLIASNSWEETRCEAVAKPRCRKAASWISMGRRKASSQARYWDWMVSPWEIP